MNVKQRIQELTKLINQSDYEYHTLDKPLISDQTYDQYLKDLITLETRYPKYKRADSPTKKIGGVVLAGFKKIAHRVPMMSLSNVFDEKDIVLFNERINKKVVNFTYITEVKLDGLAISLTYEKGLFVRAATRGDGVVGEDVTNNVGTIKSLPLKLNKEIDIEVRGEIIMPYRSFDQLNKKRLKNNEPVFANPRNAAAGTIRQLDAKIVAERNLDLFVFIIVDAQKYVSTQKEALLFLQSLGLKINPYYQSVFGVSALIKQIDNYEQIRKKLSYDTDGVVIKVNEFSFYENIGYTSKFPKWATAFKFRAEQVKTIVKAITFQIGRTGVVTPVAELEPVLISGSTVSRATLHNEDYIKAKDIRVGDYVFVHKAGEIIPEVVEVDLSQRTTQMPFEMINNCPSCNQNLTRKKSEADHYCLNPECPAQKINNLVHFASRAALNIDTLGERVIEKLYELGYLEKLSSIYKLKEHQEELKKIPGFGEKKVKKLLSAIENSKVQPFDRLLFGLGIKNVGSKVAKILVSNYPTIEKLIDANADELIDIPEIGEVIAKSVCDYFANANNQILIQEFKELGLTLSFKKEEQIEHEFNNKRFVLTGKLEMFDRDQASNIIEKLGGKVLSAVSKKTDFLIYGKEAGSKLKKANELDVKTIDEKKFKVMTDGFY